VEHTCYQCSAPVEEGVAFCPQCNAPLIRVSLPVESSSPDTTPLPPPALSRPSVVGPGTIQWSRALAPTALAGLIAFLLLPFFFGAFGLGMILAGILSAVFYCWRTAGVSLTPGMGMRLGALSGLFGFLPVLFFAGSGIVVANGSELRKAIQLAVERSAHASDPQSQQLLDFVHTQLGLTVFVTASMIFVLIIMVVLTGLGGAIAAALLRRKPHE
jgi:hypothetical protein